MKPFDVCGPLPEGTTVLEASAGTGKTYTIAALAARYVTSGIPLHEILLVTFTRLATGELSERVRERILQAQEGLTRVLDGQPAPDDEVAFTRFYMRVWLLFMLEYALVPAAVLAS